MKDIVFKTNDIFVIEQNKTCCKITIRWQNTVGIKNISIQCK